MSEPITIQEYQLMVEALPSDAIMEQKHNPDGTRDDLYTSPDGQELLRAHVDTINRTVENVFLGHAEKKPMPPSAVRDLKAALGRDV